MSNSTNKKEALGKGIRSLLQNIDIELKNTSGSLKEEILEQTISSAQIPLAHIELNPKQPRQDFDEKALQELADSIKIHGIIQPLTVSRITANRYRLVAGERRFRASKLAGLNEVPVYVRQVNDQELLELALLENLQREDLNAIEIGLSYVRLIDECSITHDELAKRMGKERSTVSNYIRLLKLPPGIVVAVRNGSISMGHARALINVDSVDQQLFVFHKIIDEGLSVRQTENAVKTLYKQGESAAKKEKKPEATPVFKKIEDNLASHFNTRVKLQHNKKGYGQIMLEYYSIEELNALLDKMNVTIH
jgi:ParB family chromosome partitioning protein